MIIKIFVYFKFFKSNHINKTNLKQNDKGTNKSKNTNTKWKGGRMGGWIYWHFVARPLSIYMNYNYRLKLTKLINFWLITVQIHNNYCSNNTDHNFCSVTGGCCGSQGRKTVVGGWGWSWCLVTDVQRYTVGLHTVLFTTTFTAPESQQLL